MFFLEVLSFNSLRHIAEEPARTYQEAFTVEVGLSEIEVDVGLVMHELAVLAQTPTPLRLRVFERRVNPANERIASRLRAIRSHMIDRPELIDGALAAFREWQDYHKALVVGVQEAETLTVYTLAKTDAAATLLRLSRDISALRMQARSLARGVDAANDELKSMALLQLLSSVGIFVLSLGLALKFMTRTIVRPAQEIGAALSRVADGNLTTDIPHKDRLDEIGHIARATQLFLDRAMAIRSSHFDLLTGLPTRGQLIDHIKIMRLDPDRANRTAAIIHFDIDRFGELNDSFGRQLGDAVLAEVSRRIQAGLRKDDFLAREAGDSFNVVVIGTPQAEELANLACEICAAVGEKMDVGDRELTIGCSAGIVISDLDAAPETLLSQAESAMQEGRKQALGSVTIYTEEMDARLRRRRETLIGLKFAIGHDEIEPFFQPQVDAASGELRGFEALVRWHNPEHGVLAPWQFIDVAAEAGLMRTITDLMIAKTASQLASWRQQGFTVPRVSLNFAASDLGSADFVDRLMLQVERTSLEPCDICVELLETAMIEDKNDPVSRNLDRLGDLGFPIELDDFGTGHAAISTLQLIKLNGIKIDRSFVTKLHERPEQLHLTRGILRISKALQIETVAEGVESEAERAVLVELGCEMVQGYSISPPMSATDATEWMVCYRPRAVGSTLAQSA